MQDEYDALRTTIRTLLLDGAAVVAIAIALVLAMFGCASKGGTQPAGASKAQYPWFTTASIKLNDPAPAQFWVSGNEFVSIEPAIDMIVFAYGEQQGPLKPVQVLGGPDWMNTEVFNIDAELPESLSDQIEPPVRGVGSFPSYPAGVGRTDALKQVFRSLLINRFKLRITHETKVLPVYELVLAKSGPKIAEDKTADRSCRMTDVNPDPASTFILGKGRRLDVKCDFNTFAGLLSASPELRSRVLVDKTGLHGRYSFKLHWTPEVPIGMHTPTIAGQSNDNSVGHPESSGPSLLTALKEQLGLEVKSTTALVDVIVIQHIENPAKN